MALRPIGGARRNATVITETDTPQTERKQIRQIRQDLLVAVNGWDAAANAQKFIWTKDAIQGLRRLIGALL